MRGIIDNQLRGLNSCYLRAFFFNNDTRVYFYSTLQEYVKSHFPLLEIFNNIQQQSNNPAIQEIAKLSKKAVRNNLPFATYYYQSGLFTEHESNLLKLGQRHNCMDTITSLLLDPDNQIPAILQILSTSIQWIFMTLVITAMSIYTLPYLQNYTSGYTLFFNYVIFIKMWWVQLVIVLIGLIAAYRWCSYRLTGPARMFLTALGFFRIHAMLIEQRFLKISSALMSARLPPNEFLLLMETTFARNRLFKQALQKGRTRLKEASLLQVLQDVLSAHTYNHLLSCTPNQTPDEIANGFNMAEHMLRIRIKKAIKTRQVFYTMLFLSISIAITIPFAFVSMGMGINFKT